MEYLTRTVKVLTFFLKDLFDSIRYYKPKYYSVQSRCPDNYSDGKIPRVIHQTQRTFELERGLFFSSMQIVYMNPEYEYKFYDDAQVLRALIRHFGEDSDQVRAYNKLIPGAWKADLFRLCILYAEGGIYLDCKVTPMIPFKSLIRPDIDFAGVLDVDRDNQRLQTGALLACAPKNPIIKVMMTEAVKSILNEDYGANPLDIAGPEKCGKILRSILRVQNLDVKCYSIENMNVHIIGKVQLFGFYIHNKHDIPILKLQSISYFFHPRIFSRYEIAWIFKKGFRPVEHDESRLK